jgi:hypothetical protein
MGFTPDKLDVYQSAIEYVGWAMLTKLGRRSCAVHEDPGEYRAGEIDADCDTDPDTGGKRKRTDGQPLASGDGSNRA